MTDMIRRLDEWQAEQRTVEIHIVDTTFGRAFRRSMAAFRGGMFWHDVPYRDETPPALTRLPPAMDHRLGNPMCAVIADGEGK